MASKFGKTLVGMMVAASTLFGAFGLAAVGTPSAAAQSNEAKLRVVHASPDAPAVDVWVNGQKAITNLAFKEASAWASLPAGSYDVKVTPTGTETGVIEAKVTLEGGKYYSAVAVGKVANITAKVFEDNFSPIAPGKARLAVVHASPDAPAVDVALTGGAVLVPNLAFPNASGTLDVDAGTYNVEVRAAGTSTVALPVPGVTLESGKLYTIYAMGLLQGTPALGVVPVADSLMTDMAGSPSAMPATGGSDLFTLGVLALLLLAAATVGTGVAVRVRNR